MHSRILREGHAPLQAIQKGRIISDILLFLTMKSLKE